MEGAELLLEATNTMTTLAPGAISLFAGLPCELEQHGLRINESASKEQWEEIGSRLAVVAKSLQWVIGDWYLYGEQQWGHKYDDCEERFGLTYSRVASCVSVARRYQFCRRRQNLTFSHHEEIQRLDDDSQDALLNECESKSLSIRDLRKRKQEVSAQDATVDIFGVPDDGAQQETTPLSRGDEESRKIVEEFKARLALVSDGAVHTLESLVGAFDCSKNTAIEFVRMCEVAPYVHVHRNYGRKGLTQYSFEMTNCVSAAQRIKQLAERIATDPATSNRAHSAATQILSLVGG